MSDFDKTECTCIGCGCTDSEPCNHGGSFCNWLRIDRDMALGVCSHCQLSVEHWDALRHSGNNIIVETDQLPECPHCHTIVANWRGNQTLLDGDNQRTTLRCTKCRQTFFAWSSITYHFSTGAVQQSQPLQLVSSGTGGKLPEVDNAG